MVNNPWKYDHIVAAPTSVPVLTSEHRDRVWRNRNGRLWRFNAGRWETLLGTLAEPHWVMTTTGESGQWNQEFGPFVEVNP